MQKVLTEQDLGHALFYALKMDDFQHARYLLQLDAPVNTSYFIEQDRLIYTTNLLIGKVALNIKKLGVSHARCQLLLTILDIFITKKCDLRCHCTPKNPHYCPLGEAFKHISFLSDADLFVEENLLILKLLYHGATLKNLSNSKEYVWVGLQALRAYMEAKKNEVIELVKMNRHSKPCTNRHTNCSVGPKMQSILL